MQYFFSEPAGDVLHHDVAQVAFDDRVEHADDVRVVQLAGERGFVEEELLEALGLLLAQVRVALGELDRDLAVVERVLGKIDDGRGPLAQFRQDGVLPDLMGAVGHAKARSRT